MNPNEGTALSAPGAKAITVPWANIGWILGLLILAYLPILARMASQWSNDDDMSHGFFVPAVAAYIAWNRREELLALEVKPSYWGLVLLGVVLSVLIPPLVDSFAGVAGGG